MFTHKENKISPHPPLFLFELVLDIENYPNFLPWCKASRFHKGKSSSTPSGGVIVADLIVGTHGISETFTSHVRYNRETLTIRTSGIDGPFNNMETLWQFKPHENNNCMIEFSVEVVFKRGLLQKLFAPFFESAIQQMVNAFEAHARATYQENINNPPALKE